MRISLVISILSFAALLYSSNQYLETQHQQAYAAAAAYAKNYKDTNNHTNQIYSETKPSSYPYQDSNKNKSSFHTYQNLNQGIEIQYPNSWTFSEENGSIVKFGQQKYLQLDDGSFVAFYSPLKGNNDTYLSNLRVYVKEPPLEIEKLSGKSHLSLLDLYAIYFSQFLQYSNFTIVEPASKTLLGFDNKSAYKIQYATKDGKQQQSMLDTFTLFNNKIYGLRYTSESSSTPNICHLPKPCCSPLG